MVGIAVRSKSCNNGALACFSAVFVRSVYLVWNFSLWECWIKKKKKKTKQPKGLFLSTSTSRGFFTRKGNLALLLGTAFIPVVMSSVGWLLLLFSSARWHFLCHFWGSIKLRAAFLEEPNLGLSVVETFPLSVLIIRCLIVLYFFQHPCGCFLITAAGGWNWPVAALSCEPSVAEWAWNTGFHGHFGCGVDGQLCFSSCFGITLYY